MRIAYVQFMPANDLATVTAWAARHALPRPWLMQVHPENYPQVKSVEYRIAFEMPDGRVELIRCCDWVGLTADGEVHGVDWLDIEKNYHLAAKAPAHG